MIKLICFIFLQPLIEKYLLSNPVDSSGPCLKDMIDMTTSGSGSGK